MTQGHADGLDLKALRLQHGLGAGSLLGGVLPLAVDIVVQPDGPDPRGLHVRHLLGKELGIGQHEAREKIVVEIQGRTIHYDVSFPIFRGKLPTFIL